MAIGTVAVGTYTEGAATATTSVPYPATVNNGDFLLLRGSVTIANSASVTNPTGWTLINQHAANSGASIPDVFAAWKWADGTEGGTSLTVTHTSQTNSFQIIAVPGVDPTTPLDSTPQAVDLTATFNTTFSSITTTTTGCLLAYVIGLNSSAATSTPPTSPAAFTETGDRVSNTRSASYGHLIWSGSGATGSITATWTVNARSVGILIPLRPAPTATDGTVVSPAMTTTTDAAPSPIITGDAFVVTGAMTLTADSAAPAVIISAAVARFIGWGMPMGALTSGLTLTLNNDGSSTISGTSVVANADGSYTITDPTVTINADGSATIST